MIAKVACINVLPFSVLDLEASIRSLYPAIVEYTIRDGGFLELEQAVYDLM